LDRRNRVWAGRIAARNAGKTNRARKIARVCLSSAAARAIVIPTVENLALFRTPQDERKSGRGADGNPLPEHSGFYGFQYVANAVSTGLVEAADPASVVESSYSQSTLADVATGEAKDVNAAAVTNVFR
jgi:hypothetical protein